MISEETISEVLERASILDFSSDLGNLRTMGKNVTALCPFHDEKTPSFHIRDDGKFYYCFGCGVSGNIVSYIMKTRGVSFPDAIHQLADQYGIEVKETNKRGGPKQTKVKEILWKIHQLTQKYFLYQLNRAPKPVLEYLNSRGLNKETIEQFGVGYAPSDWRLLTQYLIQKGLTEKQVLFSGLVRKSSKGELYDLMRGRITFPIIGVDRKVVGFGARSIPGDSHSDTDQSPKYINSPESPIYKKSNVLYGLPTAQNSARKSGVIYVLEGYFDVASFWQYGIHETVATCGTALTDGHVRILGRSAHQIRIVFDGDDAGKDSAAKSYEHFINSGLDVRAIFLPDGHDPDSFAHLHQERVRNALDEQEMKPLFDCYAEYLLRKKGYQSGECDIPPSVKGAVAKDLGTSISKVENPIERDELLKKGAFILQVDPKQLRALIGGGNENNRQQSNTSERDEAPELAENPDAIPPHEQWLIRCMMVLRQDAVLRVLNEPEIAGLLTPTTLYFLESFQSVLVTHLENQEQQRSAVKQLLESMGSQWMTLWHESYRMKQDPDVSFDRLLEECIERLREVQIRRMMSEVKEQLNARAKLSQEREAELIQMRVQLERDLRQLRAPQTSLSEP